MAGYIVVCIALLPIWAVAVSFIHSFLSAQPLEKRPSVGFYPALFVVGWLILCGAAAIIGSLNGTL